MSVSKILYFTESNYLLLDIGLGPDDVVDLFTVVLELRFNTMEVESSFNQLELSSKNKWLFHPLSSSLYLITV